MDLETLAKTLERIAAQIGHLETRIVHELERYLKTPTTTCKGVLTSKILNFIPAHPEQHHLHFTMAPVMPIPDES